MKIRVCWAIVALCVLPFSSAGDERLDTGLGVLIGVPGSAAAARAPTAAGEVVPLEQQKEWLMPGTRHPGEAALEARMLAVARDVRQALGLDEVRLHHSMSLPLVVDGEIFMPPLSPTSTARPRLTLLGFDERSATYRVELVDGETLLFDRRIEVERGLPAALTIEAARLFLVLAPPPASPATAGSEDLRPPRIVERPAPIYTKKARRAKIQGEVVVQTVVEADGSVGEVKVLKGLPKGLSEAAVAAVKRYRFEPATLEGEPVAVYYNLTINFRLRKKG